MADSIIRAASRNFIARPKLRSDHLQLQWPRTIGAPDEITTMDRWLEVDRAGLAALLERRGHHFVFAELIQNALDAPGTTKVVVEATPRENRPIVDVVVADDSPVGFTDLTHAYRLFAPSPKKANPELRGRFDLGEKLVLAVAEEAEIASTTGTLTFRACGERSIDRRAKREAGTVASFALRMTRAQLRDALAMTRRIISPVPTFVNGTALPTRVPRARCEATLPTEVADGDGVLRRVRRKTTITIYDPLPGTPPMIHELGIPIVELDEGFDLDIGQRVPVSMERDAVTPAYLREVRAHVLTAVAATLTPQEAGAAWVSDALGHEATNDDAVRAVITHRFGATSVSYDPSDREANALAVSKGLTVVHGGSLSRDAWAAVRRASALQPAGQVTPAPRPWAENGTPTAPVEQDENLRRFACFAERLAEILLERTITVEYYARFNNPGCAAAYGSGNLQFNLGRLGRAWFRGPLRAEQLELLLHEFAHEYEANHLSNRFADAIARLGAKLALAAGRGSALLALAPD